MNTRTIQNRFAEVLASVKLNQPAGTAAIIYSPFPDSKGEPVATILREPSFGGIGWLGAPIDVTATASAILALSAPGSLLVIYTTPEDDDSLAEPVVAIQHWTAPQDKEQTTPRFGTPIEGSHRRIFDGEDNIKFAIANIYLRVEKIALRNSVKAAGSGASTSLEARAHKHVSHGTASAGDLRQELASIARPSEEHKPERNGKKFSKPRTEGRRPKRQDHKRQDRGSYLNEY